MPNHPRELAHGHRMIGFHSSATGGLLPLEFTSDGNVSTLTLPATMSVNVADSYYDPALIGFALVHAPRYRAKAGLTSGVNTQAHREGKEFVRKGNFWGLQVMV